MRKPPARHRGRVTLGPCPRLGQERVCEPLNHVVIDRQGKRNAYAACTCGRRFPIDRQCRERLEAVLDAAESVDLPYPRAIGDVAPDKVLATQLWPKALITKWSKIGVAPVGTPALHRPTAWVPDVRSPAVQELSAHLVEVMRAADGIGLAANQVAAPLRMLAHNLPRVAPPVLINPAVGWRSDERWDYPEGCLSLEVEGAQAVVRRRKALIVSATLLDGGAVALHADELLGRVLQHELDHLDGIEYVQRLTDPAQQAVYRRLKEAGVDVSWLPPLPNP